MTAPTAYQQLCGFHFFSLFMPGFPILPLHATLSPIHFPAPIFYGHQSTSAWYSRVWFWTLHLVIFSQEVWNTEILNSILLWIQTKTKNPSHRLHIWHPSYCWCLLNTSLFCLLFYRTSETIWSLSNKCTLNADFAVLLQKPNQYL